MNIDNIAGINNILMNITFLGISCCTCFFILLAVKSFEIFPKHNGFDFISDFFSFNFIYFCSTDR